MRFAARDPRDRHDPGSHGAADRLARVRSRPHRGASSRSDGAKLSVTSDGKHGGTDRRVTKGAALVVSPRAAMSHSFGLVMRSGLLLECPLKIKTIVRISGGSRNRRYETRGSSLSSPPWHSKLLLHTAGYAGFRLAVNVPVTPAISTVPLIASLLSAVPL
jgi:hypothetical protein